jgi:hypothetical protein
VPDDKRGAASWAGISGFETDLAAIVEGIATGDRDAM